MCKSKYTTSLYSNHTQIHNPGTASDWPLVIDNCCSGQETLLEERVRFLWLTVTVHPCGSGNLLKLLGFVNSLFWWGPCKGCSSVSAKYQSQLRIRLNRQRFFFLCCTAELIRRSYTTSPEQTTQLNPFHWDYFLPSVSLYS